MNSWKPFWLCLMISIISRKVPISPCKSAICGEHPQVVDVGGHGAALSAPTLLSRQQAKRHLSKRVPLNFLGSGE